MSSSARWETGVTEYHHGRLREALLEEAEGQVRAVGAGKVSLRGLAGTLGVSPSAAYAHFPDKDALLVEVGQWGDEQLRARMTSAADAVGGDSDAAAVARLKAIGEAYVGFAAGEPRLCRRRCGPRGSAPDGGPPEGGSYPVLDHHLRELDRRGLIRVDADDEVLRLLFWSVVHGFALLVIEGQVDPGAGTSLLDTLGRLALTDL